MNQWWTARNKLRLDLFDRRWAVYFATRAALSAAIQAGNSDVETRRTFLGGIRGAQFLFTPAVNAYLMQLHNRLLDLQMHNEMLTDQQNPDRQKHVTLKGDCFRWVMEQNESGVDEMLGPFLVLDQGMFDAAVHWYKRHSTR